jgi:uncharacterized protein YbaP (TraB family)
LFLNRFRRKALKTVWRLEKNGRRSFLVGTAHFFPYSFKTSTTKLLTQVNKVLFEGPLDEISMSKVVDAGLQGDSSDCILNELDEATVAKIAKVLAPASSSRSVPTGLEMVLPIRPDNYIREMVKGMRPWMAFFAIYSRFLQNNGWKYSVDMEAFHLAKKMGKDIIPLETIEEQIEVLETVSRAQIIDFLKRIDQWDSYTRDFVKWYLDGDLEKISSNPYRFPTRSPLVIEDRDKVFYERMLTYLEQGDAAVLVGIPHVMGISRLLSADGYLIQKIQD